MKLRSVTASAIAAAMLATSVTPAMAQGYPGGFGGYARSGGYDSGYGGYRHDRDRHDGIGAGGIIAGIAAIGIIAAIASSNSHAHNSGYDTRYRGNADSESGATNACAAAAEQRYGSVSSIDQVYRTGDGYRISGIVQSSDGNYGRGGYAERFNCSVRYGSVERIDIDSRSGYRGY